MGENVVHRLRKVDRRIAKIDRNRIGSLQSRVYFNPNGAPDWEEVEIFGFEDLGITPENVATGEELSAHRFRIKLSKDWQEAHDGQDGVWGISRIVSGVGSKALPFDQIIECESEDEAYQDKDTFATLILRVTQSITIPNQEISIE